MRRYRYPICEHLVKIYIKSLFKSENKLSTLQTSSSVFERESGVLYFET